MSQNSYTPYPPALTGLLWILNSEIQVGTAEGCQEKKTYMHGLVHGPLCIISGLPELASKKSHQSGRRVENWDFLQFVSLE